MAGPRFVAALVVSCALLGGPASPRARAEIRRERVPTLAAAAAGLPLRFEENRGQFSAPARFAARARGFTLFVTPGEAVLAAHDGGVLRMRIEGAAPVEPVPSNLLAGTTNYFRGNDQSRWLHGVPGYGTVEQRGVLPGIDLVFRGNPARPEYDLHIAPGVDPAKAVFAFDGAEGLSLDAMGGLVVRLASGEVRHGAPRAWQDLPSGRREVAARFTVLDGRRAGFVLGARDPSHAVVVDPELTYSSYLGGTGPDNAVAVALDSTGKVVLLGNTASTDFPTASAYQNSLSCGDDCTITKFNPATGTLVFSTYFGGNAGCNSSTDAAEGLALDGTGRIYVCGKAGHLSFPTMNPLQAWSASGDPSSNGFVSVFSADGNFLLFSTTLGGTGLDHASAIAVKADASIFVAGETDGFPVTGGAFQTVMGSSRDAFVAKINPGWTALSWASYLGGSSATDIPQAIALDSTGGVVVGGYTTSTNFPLQGATQGTSGGNMDGFVTRFASDGASITFSTYYGGTLNDRIDGLAVDASGGILIGGQTNSTNLPGTGGFQAALGGSNDAFIARIKPDLSAVDWKTYLGGTGSEILEGFAAGPAGTVWASGSTASTAFTVTGDALQSNYGGSTDGWMARIASGGASLEYSSYCGGSNGDSAMAVAVDSSGRAWVLGNTQSTNFSVTAGALQSTHLGSTGAYDYFLREVSPDEAPPPPPPGVPYSPSGLEVSPLSGTSLTVSWTDNSDNETGFEVVRSAEGGPYLLVASVAIAAMAWQDDACSPDRSYSYMVRALGSAGNSAYSTAAASTTLSTMDFVLSKGQVVNGPRFGKDHGDLQGTFHANAMSEDGLVDALLEGFEVTLGETGGTVLASIPAADAGWKGKGAKRTWKSPRSDGLKVKLTLIPSTGAFRITVGGLELPALAAGPLRLRIAVGDDAGSLRGPWTAHAKKAGILLYR